MHSRLVTVACYFHYSQQLSSVRVDQSQPANEGRCRALIHSAASIFPISSGCVTQADRFSPPTTARRRAPDRIQTDSGDKVQETGPFQCHSVARVHVLRQQRFIYVTNNSVYYLIPSRRLCDPSRLSACMSVSWLLDTGLRSLWNAKSSFDYRVLLCNNVLVQRLRTACYAPAHRVGGIKR